MKKWIVSLIFLGLAGFLLWHFRFALRKDIQKLPDFANSPIIQTIKQDISTPPPLIGSLLEQNSHLTRAGVIYWTNQQRAENGGLPAIKENTLLDNSAELKLADMFKKQYFEHISPTGVGPSDLAKSVGYDYVSIGENLALGNFADDKALVQAWMNSPGHRANILNKGYQEIGVAVGQGMYQGHKTWLAVQEFGRPASSCPAVDANLKTQINNLQAEVNQLQPQVESLKNQIDSENPKTKEEVDAYNQQVAQYNSLVDIFDNKIDQLKLATTQYNNQVNSFNACIGG